MLTQFFKLFERFIKQVPLFILLLFVLYTLSFRIALSILPKYTQDLEDYFSSVSGELIEIQDIKSYWVGLDPVLEFNQISINGSQNAYLGRTRIRLSLINSIKNLQLSLKSISTEHVEISLDQTNEGAWIFAGIELQSDFLGRASDDDINSDTVLEFNSLTLPSFLEGTTVSISDISLTLTTNAGLVRALRSPLISLSNQNNLIYASGKILEKEGDKSLLGFSYEGGKVSGDSNIFGELFIEARSTEFFSQLMSVYQWEDLSIESIDGGTRAWLYFENTSLKSVTGDLQLSSVDWTLAEKQLPALSNLAMNYSWRSEEEGSLVSIEGFGYSWAGQKCQESDATIKNSLEEIAVKLSNLDIGCLSRLAVSTGVLPPKLQHRLEVSRPAGLLQNIRLDIPLNSELETQFKLQAELSQVSLKAFESTPSGSGIDGYVYADSKGGHVQFDSDKFELGFPRLFYKPWLMKKAEGEVSWVLGDDSVQISSEGLRLWQSDESLVYGDFSLLINPKDQEDYLTLAIAVQDIDFTNAPNFVPGLVVGDDLHSWLNTSLVSGKVQEGVYYGLGSTETVSAENSFTSSIYLRTSAGELKFSDEWPHLKELNADIYLQNEKLLISAEGAEIHETKLKKVDVILPEVQGSGVRYLEARALSEADQSIMQYWLKSSPISEHTNAIADQIVISGDVAVDIFLEIPMTSGFETKYNINTKLNGVDVLHKDSDVLFSNLRGSLAVSSEGGVEAKNVLASVFEQEAMVSILSDYNDVNDHKVLNQTNITLEGGVSVARLFKHFKQQPIKSFNGNFNYFAVLSLPSQQGEYPNLSIKSDFLGVERDMPFPLKKLHTEIEPLNINLLLKPNQFYLNASLGLASGNELSSELLFVDQIFSFGEVLINQAEVLNTNISGLNIAADLDNVELEPWLNFIEELINNAIKTVETEETVVEEGILKQVQLNVGHLNAFGQDFSDTHVILKNNNNTWSSELDGPTIKGLIVPAYKEKPLQLKLDHLFLSQSTGGIVDKDAVSIVPSDIPFLTFSAKKLFINDHNYGAWSTKTELTDNGIIFRKIKGKVADSTIKGQLNWQLFAEGHHNSILTLDMKGEKVEGLLTAFDIDPLMTSERFNSSLAFVWPNTPLDFSFEHLSGKFKLKMEDGSLKTEDDKTDVLRIFGILNSDAILRRLKLDFSDLYKSGISYDSLDLTSTVDQGLLTLNNPLVIDGPSGNYVINGNTNLHKETLDLELLLALPFSQNVPLAALALGVPQIGGAVWLVDKLLGEPLSALTTARYDITGTWGKPKVELGQAINATNKK